MINNLHNQECKIVDGGTEFGYPVRHRRKVPFQPTTILSTEVAHWNREIFKLDSELDRFILTGTDYMELIGDAFASNIHYSTKLEGNPIPLNEVRRITKGTLKTGSYETKYDFPIQEIVNHIGTYLNLQPQRWDTDFVKRIHELLLFGSDTSKPGRYRTTPISVYSDRKEELFIACPPGSIAEEMESLMEWVHRCSLSYYPVIAGSILFHEFESIHPFYDGNGRTGRTLFHLYLQANGLPNSKLCFIEHEILSNTDKYYELLSRTDFYDNYDDLVHHITKAVMNAYQNAVSRYKEKDLLSKDLDEISKRILVKAKETVADFDLKEARKWIDGASDFQLRKRMDELIELGAIMKKGSTRSLKYHFADPVKEMAGKWERMLIELDEQRNVGNRKDSHQTSRSRAGKG